MLGAIIGDIVGSTREFENVKTENFELLPKRSRFTDDTVMTLAVAEWLMTDPDHTPQTLVECMQRLGRKYPKAGYGASFAKWLKAENPQPYNSYGNGSAMRVSPCGLYAKTLAEAIELARISASVTHDYPEDIEGAEAIAAAVFIHKNEKSDADKKIKRLIEEIIGYNLDIDLDELRPNYKFDLSCHGSVPIALMAYLRHPHNAESALRLAISMGGDSDTIGAMTASISNAKPFYGWNGDQFSHEIVAKCRKLLPAELLDINDRFEKFISKPLDQSYVVYATPGFFFAGEYPGDKDEAVARRKITRMVHFGVKHFIDLTEEHELRPYRHLLPEGCTYHRFPIKDVCAPQSVESVDALLTRIDLLRRPNNEYVYLHCHGGVGRTGTIVACHLARYLSDNSLESVLKCLRDSFSDMPKSKYSMVPESKAQIDFIQKFINQSDKNKEDMEHRVKDCIRGCLMAGAAGDALGYEVEFMMRSSILDCYGERGIRQFKLDGQGKALVSDDTQMTLFTANGLLMGVTRCSMRGIGARPECYVDGAYLDWYYTQTNKKKDTNDDFHYTWLRDLPELQHRRAPGNTCLDACAALLAHREVRNYSKGCGGIMRVAPMALLMTGYAHPRGSGYQIEEMMHAGAEIARVTHKHPLGFLPAALLTHLIYSLIPLSAEEGSKYIAEFAEDSLRCLDDIYIGEFTTEKNTLAIMTHCAIKLAKSDMSDAEAIRTLGEGWTGDEAWLIALFCAIRHADNMDEAIIAAVNHDGDSDSTGSICGNIMGAIYGYEAILRENMFCQNGRKFAETLELHDIILALADDLYTGCIIGEYSPIDTPEKRQWYERYCEMKPAGIDPKSQFSPDMN